MALLRRYEKNGYAAFPHGGPNTPEAQYARKNEVATVEECAPRMNGLAESVSTYLSKEDTEGPFYLAA